MKAQLILNKALKSKEALDREIRESSIDNRVDPQYIPDSWVDDNGIRHAVVWTDSMPDYMRLKKINGKWVLNEQAPF